MQTPSNKRMTDSGSEEGAGVNPNSVSACGLEIVVFNLMIFFWLASSGHFFMISLSP